MVIWPIENAYHTMLRGREYGQITTTASKYGHAIRLSEISQTKTDPP